MRTKKNIINLYEDKDINNIKQVISIANEEDLNLFWNFISDSDSSAHSLMYTFITQFYNFALNYMQNSDTEFFEIILEDTDKYFYFTLWNKKISLLFKEHIQKTSLSCLYHDNKLTIRLNKLKFQKNIEKIYKKNEKRTEKLIQSVNVKETIKVKEPYSFIESDDLEELLKLNDDMQELVFLLQQHSLTAEIFISLRSSVSLFCLTLRYYDKISPMSTIITDFSNLLNLHRNEFVGLDKNQLDLVCGFINNINRWLENLFIVGGADLYFMDNSMQADLDTISYMISPSKGFDTDDLDNIFDF